MLCSRELQRIHCNTGLQLITMEAPGPQGPHTPWVWAPRRPWGPPLESIVTPCYNGSVVTPCYNDGGGCGASSEIRRPLVGHQAAREVLSGLQLVVSRLIRLEGLQIAVLQAYQADRITDCSPCRLVSCSKQHVFCFLLTPGNTPLTTHLALTLSLGRSQSL